jgi:hypothetical protein
MEPALVNTWSLSCAVRKVTKALEVGDLVVPTGATNPAFMRRHGFGVIVEVTGGKGITFYEVKFTKSLMMRKFAFDAVRRHG